MHNGEWRENARAARSLLNNLVVDKTRGRGRGRGIFFPKFCFILSSFSNDCHLWWQLVKKIEEPTEAMKAL